MPPDTIYTFKLNSTICSVLFTASHIIRIYIVLLTLLKPTSSLTQLSVGLRLFDGRNGMILVVSVISPVSIRGRYRTKLNLHGLHPRKFNNFSFVYSISLWKIILQTAQAHGMAWWWYFFTRRNISRTKSHEYMKIIHQLFIIYSNVYSFSLFVKWLVLVCTVPSASYSRLRRVKLNWIELEMRIAKVSQDSWMS